MNAVRTIHMAAWLCLAIGQASATARAADRPAATLEVRAAGVTRSIGIDALARLPQQAVTAHLDGRELTCTGPMLAEVPGLKTGPTWHGSDALREFVLAQGADGYRVVFSRAELEPALHARVPIIALRCAGQPLDARSGPLRIIAPADLRGARSVFRLKSLDVRRVP